MLALTNVPHAEMMAEGSTRSAGAPALGSTRSVDLGVGSTSRRTSWHQGRKLCRGRMEMWRRNLLPYGMLLLRRRQKPRAWAKSLLRKGRWSDRLLQWHPRGLLKLRDCQVQRARADLRVSQRHPRDVAARLKPNRCPRERRKRLRLNLPGRPGVKPCWQLCLRRCSCWRSRGFEST